MLRSVIIAASVLLAPLIAFAGPPSEANLWNGAEINWRDARSGIYESSQTGRPVIMVFQATWCPVCKRFRSVFKDPRIVAESKDFVMVLVDADKEKMLNGAFSPDGTYVPRTLFLDSDGNVSDKLVGTDSEYPHTIDVDNPDQLLALMKKAHSVFNMPPAEAAPVDGSRT
jgi:thiol-disulfide isomerase/thioredoxin